MTRPERRLWSRLRAAFVHWPASGELWAEQNNSGSETFASEAPLASCGELGLASSSWRA